MFLLNARLLAMMTKEFIQLRRDRTSLLMVVGIPLMQLILFGCAINLNPRYLPTAVVNPDQSEWGRRILTSMDNSTYFRFVAPHSTEQEAAYMLKTGQVQFVVTFPMDFSHDLVKGFKPTLLLEADATDPAATSRAVSVFTDLAQVALKKELTGPLKPLNAIEPPYRPVVHTVYNPLAITSYNIVPGLLGVVLTMTLAISSAVAVTREFERGTMENLLATPLTPIEVMIGKLAPFILVGYTQVALILLAAKFIFGVPMQGSIFLLLLLCLPFIVANLSMGLMFSTIAANQLQAVQSAMFFFLPSLLLSGFMFPFRGMPEWAQWLGSMLPLTHFLMIVRGILLKGNGLFEVWREVVPIIIFMLVALGVGVSRYHKTLD